MEYTDKELVERHLRGSEDAFQILLRRHLRPVFHFVRSYVNDEQQAEDITQDVFLKLWTHLQRFDPSKSFKVWMYTIAKHSVFDYLRKKKVLSFSSLEDDGTIHEIADDQPLPDEQVMHADSEKTFDAMIEKIPVIYREILVLHYREGFSLQEISEILGTSPNTVKSRHLRALAMLKKILGGAPE